MNEPEIAKQITSRLNVGLTQLGDEKLAKLRAARQNAMAQYREPVSVFGLASVSGHTLNISSWLHKPLFWLPILTIVAASVAYNAMDDDIADEAGALDAQLLSGELPINAFLDKDFQSWVKDSSR